MDDVFGSKVHIWILIKAYSFIKAVKLVRDNIRSVNLNKPPETRTESMQQFHPLIFIAQHTKISET